MKTKDKHTNILLDMPNTKKGHIFTNTKEKLLEGIH
jgi:hypothetical protein